MQASDIALIVDQEFSDDPYLLVSVVTPDGDLDLLSEVEVASDHIVVRNLHVQGDVRIKWGGSKLRLIGRLIAEKLDVDYIEVHGAVRTTGANPGRRPGVVRLSRPREPQLSPGSEYT